MSCQNLPKIAGEKGVPSAGGRHHGDGAGVAMGLQASKCIFGWAIFGVKMCEDCITHILAEYNKSCHVPFVE